MAQPQRLALIALTQTVLLAMRRHLEPDQTLDIAIVGARIAGVSLAYFAARHATVLLLEREAQPALHSTGRSAAMLVESDGSPQRALTRAGRPFSLRRLRASARCQMNAARSTSAAPTRLLRCGPCCAAAQGGYGVQTSAAMGALCAAWLLRLDPPAWGAEALPHWPSPGVRRQP